MQFTEEQLRAIKTRDTNILVSAGAGSGKTGVLTERILDRLRDGDSINELLVLTYTKAVPPQKCEAVFVQKLPMLWRCRKELSGNIGKNR